MSPQNLFPTLPSRPYSDARHPGDRPDPIFFVIHQGGIIIDIAEMVMVCVGFDPVIQGNNAVGGLHFGSPAKFNCEQYGSQVTLIY